MINNFKNFDSFFNSVIFKKKIFYQNNITISESLDSKINAKNDFIFEKKYLFLFNTKGNLIFSEHELGNNEYKEIIRTILIKIIRMQNREGNKMNKNIFCHVFFINEKDKLVFVRVGNTNIISFGVFSIKTKTSIIKLYLLNFIIMFLNYIDAEINALSNLENNIHINIYKEFLYCPFHQYYLLLTKQIFQRQRFKLKNIFYNNYYLIELNANKIIFSFESLFNNIDKKLDIYQIKIHNNENIWNEILYHCHILKNNYMNQNSLNFNEDNYENFYAVFELKSTFPRRTFIIRFLPVLNGLGLIHEFVQTKLSSNEGNENNHYKEYESIYGYLNEINTLSQKTCNSTHSRFIIFKNEPIFLKKINSFFIGSLSLKNQHSDLFYWRKHRNIFISEEIMNIIKDVICLMKKKQINNNNNIIKEIEKELHKEYQEEIKEKKDLDLNIYNNSNNNILLYNNDNDFIENNLSQKIDLGITKNFILMTLFNSKDKNTSNFSKVLSSQKDLNILKENSLIKKFPSSKKDLNKLSEILNENISENICSNYNSNNRNLKENNSFKISNICDSINNNLNIENSVEENNIFDINISIINNEEQKINDNDNNNEVDNKTNKEEENKISEQSDDGYVNSKNEFLEGEFINKVK